MTYTHYSKYPKYIHDHLISLEKNIYLCLTLKKSCKKASFPSIFEYYSAIHMTKLINKPFFVYDDFSKEAKLNQNFPTRDIGIDLICDSLDIIGQSKYYSSKSYITYGKLSTFLATEKLVGKPLSFYLIRSDNCRLDNNVKYMIKNNVIHDIPLNKDIFLKDIKIINDKYAS